MAIRKLTIEQLAMIAIILDEEEEECPKNTRRYWIHNSTKKKRKTEEEYWTFFRHLVDDEEIFLMTTKKDKKKTVKMKGLLMLLIVGAGYAYPVARTWTFHELSQAISWKNPEGKDPEQKAIIDAFNEMMAALYSGKENYVQAIRLSPNGSKVWTMEQLKQALINNHTDPILLPYVERAYSYLSQQNQNENGIKQDTVEVWVPTLDISTWTENEVSTALKDPEVNPDLIPLLKSAQKEFEEAKAKGEKLESVKVITPVGVIPKPEGQPILYVPRPVHENMLANKEQLMAHHRESQQQKIKQ